MLGGFLTGRPGKQILFTRVWGQIVVGLGDGIKGDLGEVAQDGSAVWAVVCHLAWDNMELSTLVPLIVSPHKNIGKLWKDDGLWDGQWLPP